MNGHLMSADTADQYEAVVAWRCQRCGEWIQVYGPPPEPCQNATSTPTLPISAAQPIETGADSPGTGERP